MQTHPAAYSRHSTPPKEARLAIPAYLPAAAALQAAALLRHPGAQLHLLQQQLQRAAEHTLLYLLLLQQLPLLLLQQPL
jgi:hypothetical protein